MCLDFMEERSDHSRTKNKICEIIYTEKKRKLSILRATHEKGKIFLAAELLRGRQKRSG